MQRSERSVQRGEVAVAGVLGLIGVVGLVGGLRYGIGDGGRLGPGAVPAFLGAALLVLAATIAVRAPATAPVAESDGDDEHLGKAFVILGLVAAAVALAPVIGLLPAMAALTFVIALGVERLGLLTSAVLAGGSLVVFYAVFELLLELPMPGPW